MANPYASEAALFLVGLYMIISYLFNANMFQPKYAEDRVVLVTDSTSKFGRQLTLEYARMHAKLFLVGVDEASLANVTVDCLRAGANDVASVVGDVSHSHVRRSLLTAVQQRHGGRLDYLIMNHAEPNNHAEWNDTEALRDAVDDYLLSHVELTALALPSLKASRGHVAVVSSMAGKVSLPHQAGVSAVKAAINAYFAAMRQELKRRNGEDEYVSVTSVTVAYMDGLRWDGGGRWGRLFGRWGTVKVEDAVAWIAHSVGGRKKEVTYPFAAQCHSVLHSWFPSLYEDPRMPTFNHLLPFIST